MPESTAPKAPALALPLTIVDETIIEDGAGHVAAEVTDPWRAAAIVAAVNDSAALRSLNAELVAALEHIANEPCDHGPGPFCPRDAARAALARAQQEVPRVESD